MKLLRDKRKFTNAMLGLHNGKWSQASADTRTLYSFLVTRVYPKIPQGGKEQRDDLNIWHRKYKGDVDKDKYISKLTRADEAIVIATLTVKAAKMIQMYLDQDEATDVPEQAANSQEEEADQDSSSDSLSDSQSRSTLEGNDDASAVVGEKRAGDAASGAAAKRAKISGRQKPDVTDTHWVKKKEAPKFLKSRLEENRKKPWIGFYLATENWRGLDDEDDVEVHQTISYEMSKHVSTYSGVMKKVVEARDGPGKQLVKNRDPRGWYAAAATILNDARKRDKESVEEQLKEVEIAAKAPDTNTAGFMLVDFEGMVDNENPFGMPEALMALKPTVTQETAI